MSLGQQHQCHLGTCLRRGRADSEKKYSLSYRSFVNPAEQRTCTGLNEVGIKELTAQQETGGRCGLRLGGQSLRRCSGAQRGLDFDSDETH